MKALPIAISALGLEIGYAALAIHGQNHNYPFLVGLLMLTHLFYIFCTYWIYQNKSFISKWLVLAPALIFRFTFAAVAPGLSEDVFRYRWEGQIQTRGENPYLTRPTEKIPGKDFRSGYGPVTTLIERATFVLAARITDDPSRQAIWMKLPAILVEAGTLALLWNLPVEQLVWYAWSPVPIVEIWWNGHNDALAVFFLILALFLARRDRSAWAFASLGLAIACKWWPAVLWPLFAWKKPRWSWVTIPIVMFTALPYLNAPLGEFVENARFMSGFVGGWRNNDSLFGIILVLAGDAARAKFAAFSLIAVSLVYFARWPLEKGCFGAIVTTLLVSANCHPWYLTWFTPLLVYEPWLPAVLWSALMPLAYRVLIDWNTLGQWNGSNEERWWIYPPLFAMMAFDWLRRRISWRR